MLLRSDHLGLTASGRAYEAMRGGLTERLSLGKVTKGGKPPPGCPAETPVPDSVVASCLYAADVTK